MDLLKRSLACLGLSLTSEQLEDFHLYYQELVIWNQRFNLTRIIEYREVQTRHFLDSLSARLVLPEEFKSQGRIIDVGAGAGFPGLPLKIACPDMNLTMVESVRKKSAFLNHLISALRLSKIRVCADRAENLAHDQLHRETYDVVLARGVAPLRSLAELTIPFCHIGGILIAYKGTHLQEEIHEALPALTTLGGEIVEEKRVNINGLKNYRTLIAIRKVRPTPPQYPRRSGMPRKRPL